MNYETLKAAVANVIKTNGNEEITGQLLQDVLIAIINALGSGYQFMGIATAETTPGTPDQRVFYLAGSAGSTALPGFGITVDHEICVLMYSDEWEKQTLLQFDSELTSGSQNLVTSGMVYDAITNLSQAINGLAEIVGGHTTAIESLQETVGGHTTAINNLQYAVVAIQAAIESLQTDVAQKIDKSDADSLVVGSAQGVLATSAVEAFFLFQQSGAAGDGAALIPTIKGKTIAWNQLFNGDYGARSILGIAGTIQGGRVIFNGTPSSTSTITLLPSMPSTIVGHKYFVYYSGSHSGCTLGYRGVMESGSDITQSFIGIASSASTLGFTISPFSSSTPISIDCYLCVFDLTLLGLGDLTADQFKALYPALYYAPASVLKSNDAAALLTDGRNQWDEDSLAGYHSSSTGDYAPANDQITTKNPIPVFAGKEYYCNKACTWYYYDSAMNFISAEYKGSAGVVTIPSGASYAHLGWGSTYGATYNNDICVNLSDPSFNGTYEPYWQRVLALRISELTGIPEGGTEADRVTMFPNGLGGAGTSYDSIVEGKGYKRRARVNLGGLVWDYRQEVEPYYFQAPANTLGIAPCAAANVANIICQKYATRAATVEAGDAVGIGAFNSGANYFIRVIDTAYTDAATFKAAMDGVYLEYELATPIVYTDLQYADGTPFMMPQMFRTAQGGTMLIVSPEGATAPSAPFSADIIYPVDPIASSGASLKNLLEALKTATVITSYTMTFNSTTQQYEFTITK